MLTTFLVSVIFLLGCENDVIPATGVSVDRQPAEFEIQHALWINWPHVEHKTGYSNEEVIIEIVEAVTLSGQRVEISAYDQEVMNRAMNLIQSQITNSDLVGYHIIPHYEWWIRDTGPAFVLLETGEMAVVNFRFNAWGYTTWDDEEVLEDAAFAGELGRYLGMPVIESEMISEGGNREVNGAGTLILTAEVEEGRNPGWTRDEMEREFERVFGVTNVIWLEQGIIDDQHTFLGPLITHKEVKAYTVVTTNGHIDVFARFVNETTILLGYVPEDDLTDDPIAQENHRRMEQNYNTLSESRDQDGNPFTIVRIPLTRSLVHTMSPGDYVYDNISTMEYADGHQFPVGEEIHVIAAASYLNFVITNHLIIGQKYWREGMNPMIRERDQKVEEILRDLFPERDVLMIDAIAVNLGGGGLHCVTLHQPIHGRHKISSDTHRTAFDSGGPNLPEPLHFTNPKVQED